MRALRVLQPIVLSMRRWRCCTTWLCVLYLRRAGDPARCSYPRRPRSTKRRSAERTAGWRRPAAAPANSARGLERELRVRMRRRIEVRCADDHRCAAPISLARATATPTAPSASTAQVRRVASRPTIADTPTAASEQRHASQVAEPNSSWPSRGASANMISAGSDEAARVTDLRTRMTPCSSSFQRSRHAGLASKMRRHLLAAAGRAR